MPETGQNSSAGFSCASPWLLRVPAAVLLAAVLALQGGRIDGFNAGVIYAASWIILLHALIGEYVFIRHLHAVSRNQQALDGFAALLLLGGFFFISPYSALVRVSGRGVCAGGY